MNIVITGTSRGIGLELAKILSKSGEHQVAGISRSDASFSHPNYFHISADLTNESETIDAVRNIYTKWKRIDVLINNAATGGLNSFISTPADQMKQILHSNILGVALITREVSKKMISHNFGRIINFSTASSALYPEMQSMYSAGKAAVESLTRSLAIELAPYEITVNTIGITPMDIGLVHGIPDDWIKNITNAQAIKRKTNMSDITNLVAFLLDPKSDFLTGQWIFLGGVWK